VKDIFTFLWWLTTKLVYDNYTNAIGNLSIFKKIGVRPTADEVALFVRGSSERWDCASPSSRSESQPCVRG